MDKNSNIYTFLFVGVMVIGIASILAFTSQTLKPMQKENVKNEKMQNILSTIGINVSREEAEGLYSKYIKEELALKIDGSVNESLNPFSEINLAKELKKDYENQHFPLYIAEVESEITKDWFKESFVDEKVFNENGELVGITVLKGNNDPKNQDKNDHEVDAISGSTITGDGVTNMIKERLNNYLPYLEKLNIAQL